MRNSDITCPQCAARNSEVRDSRSPDSENRITRRRVCLACGSRFTTYEIPREEYLRLLERQAVLARFNEVLSVIDRDGAPRPDARAFHEVRDTPDA